MTTSTLKPLLILLALSTGCGPATVTGQGSSTADTVSQASTISHTFDLSQQMPEHLAVMYSMSWFGIPDSDPQGAGPDPGYGNTKWGKNCVQTNDPATCNTCLLYGAGDVCLQTGAPQRDVASRRRMLAGPYSASALNVEGRRRVDLMLSNVRRPCDDGAKIDAWAVQLNGTHSTALHPKNPQGITSNLSYHATVAFLEEADNAGLTNAVMPGDDATFYFHFGTDVGLGACDDSKGNPKQNCIDALTQDFVDMSNLATAHPSALRIAGKPVLFIYFDSKYLTPSQWQSIFQNARNQSGHDFYMVGAIQNASATDAFQAFDALAPWVNVDWTSSSGATVRQHAASYAAALHQALHAAVSAYPGREVFGGVSPGFDDWTENWGACAERQLPPGDPRDPQMLLGEFDYLLSQKAKGVILETWDDWTEGTEFEPDVLDGTNMLVSLRDNLGRLYGEPSDPLGDQRLNTRWTGYGQARDCSGNPAILPPVTALTCASVTISSPANGATITGPVTVAAQATESVPVNQMQVWDNGHKLGWYAGSSVNQTYALAVGNHALTVEDLDDSYHVLHQTVVSFTVSSGVSAGVGPHGGSVPLLHFGATGDTRPGTSEAEGVIDYPSAIINGIATQLKAREVQFVVDLGDHMNNWHDLTAAQEMMAKYESAMKLYGNTWFMTMGNHECDMPYPINCVPFAGQPGSTAVNFLTYLNALKGTGVSSLPWYSFDVQTSLGLARFVVIADNAWCPEQQAWLESTLTAADTQAVYTLVLRHHPPDDGGAPGEISQIVRQHKFALYMTGHAHMYQHLTTDSGRDLILGTGGAPLQNVSKIPGAHAINGYVVVDQQANGQLAISVFDSVTDTLVEGWSVGPNP